MFVPRFSMCFSYFFFLLLGYSLSLKSFTFIQVTHVHSSLSGSLKLLTFTQVTQVHSLLTFSHVTHVHSSYSRSLKSRSPKLRSRKSLTFTQLTSTQVTFTFHRHDRHTTNHIYSYSSFTLISGLIHGLLNTQV